ncbi:MAG: hypothetical protein ACI9BF_000499 [Candidatus Paceibacteria bacterium]|jgi:hypothetical protein
MNEERSGSDYSEFISQSAALACRRLLDEYSGSGLQETPKTNQLCFHMQTLH